MTVRLLDVNVLVSLLDSAHVHHDTAVTRFRSPAQAAESLPLFKAGFPGIHRFWPDAISLTDSTLFDLAVPTGSRQTTDAYLAALAFRNRARLATLDGGIPWRAVRGADGGLIERIFA